MRFGVPAGARSNFRDRSPLILHQATDDIFAIDVAVVGIDYTVPADRAAVIEQIHGILRLNNTIALNGGMNVRVTYVNVDTTFSRSFLIDLQANDGPGDYPFSVSGTWQMAAGDRITVSNSFTSPSPSGILKTTFHGVEYDA